MIREVHAPKTKIISPDGPDCYRDAIKKALDGWFVDMGAVIDDASDELIDRFATDTYNAIAPYMDLKSALVLELVIEPPVFPVYRRLFLTRRGNCTYRLVGIGKDGLEYERA